jgi:hypothetical protein
VPGLFFVLLTGGQKVEARLRVAGPQNKHASFLIFLFRLKTKNINYQAFESEPKTIKSGIFLWFERRNTLSEIPLVDGRSAMLWKLGGSALSDMTIGRTR